jgi:beta-galactosidase
VSFGNGEDVIKVVRISAIGLAAGLFSALAAGAAEPPAARRQLSADFDWKFCLGDPAGAEAPRFADASWRTVHLPHDWSIEGKPDSKNPTGSGGGYFPAGIGWYRKTFRPPADWKGKRVSAEFEGAYMNATVFLNGHRLGTHAYGYTPFRFDLTPELDFSRPNVLAVRVDNSEQPNSRWYSGSGLYRHVRLVVTGPAHIDPWGVFVTTPEVSEDRARVSVRTRIRNEADARMELVLRTVLTGPAGRPVGEAQSPVSVGAGEALEITEDIRVDKPALWSPASPRLYSASTRIVSGGRVIDELVTPFGIRSLAWSAGQGFRLNGKAIKLAGGSVHHDNGPLGAAAFDRAEERKAELLKAAGYNAVRTAHNPPSTAFLDACDRLGLLVLEEAFDTWGIGKLKFDYGRHFDEWWQQDITAMVLRDRNHPSVVIWSIGNEIPEVWSREGAAIAGKLAAQVRSLDSTRPLTQAFPGSTSSPNADAVFAVLDIGGYNYNLAANHAEDHRRVPGRIMMATESFPSDAFEQWRLVKDNPYIIGEFVWTAMDYLGESGIGAWTYGTPEQAARAAMSKQIVTVMADKIFSAMANGGGSMTEVMAQMSGGAGGGSEAMGFGPGASASHSAHCGDLDLTGHRKPVSHYRDILWNGGDRVYAAVRLPEPEGRKIIAMLWAVVPTLPSWTWPGQEGKELQVEVYSGAERVRVFLNDRLIGEKPAGEEQRFQAVFSVPYTPGTLRAVGVRGGREVAESVLATAGEAVRLRLTADRASVKADGQDLSFITVEAVDAKGRLQPNAAHEIRFTLSGPGTIVAAGNGDGKSSEGYQGGRCTLFHGRALAIVRTSKTAGSLRLEATAPGLDAATVTIRARRSVPRAEVR